MIICLEGPDGVGKTTLARYIEKQHGFIYMRCPGTTAFGEVLRPWLKNERKVCSQEAKALAFAAADLDAHVAAMVVETEGKNVIMDRCGLSNKVYREANGEMAMAHVMDELFKACPQALWPSGAIPIILTRSAFELDLVAMGEGRKNDADEGMKFPDRVRAQYDKISGFIPRVAVVERDIATTVEDIIEAARLEIEDQLLYLRLIENWDEVTSRTYPIEMGGAILERNMPNYIRGAKTRLVREAISLAISGHASIEEVEHLNSTRGVV